MRRPASLATRLVLWALVWLALLLAIGGVVLSAAFRETVERSFENRLDALARAMVAAVEVTPEGVTMPRSLGDPRFERIYSGWYWQISGRGERPLRSRSLWDARLEVHPTEGARQTRRAVGPGGEPLLVVEQDVDFPDAGGPVHLLIAGDLREVAGEVRGFDLLLAASMAVLALGLVIATLLQVRFGLRPLRRLVGELDRVRAGEGARLEGGHPREIAPLVEAMNAVLDHDEALIERARTHLGNLAHALKTPLSILKAEVRDGADLAAVGDQVRTMDRLIHHHLARASAAAGSGRALGARLAVAAVLDEMRTALQRIYADKAIAIDAAADPQALFRGRREDLEEILGNLLDNACKWGRAQVRARAAAASGELILTVEDDGPGLSEEEAREASRRGARLDQMTPGWGLGLAIVADLVALHGGTVGFGRSDLGGLKVEVRLPT